MGVLVVLSSEVSVVTLVLLTTARVYGVAKVIISIVITTETQQFQEVIVFCGVSMSLEDYRGWQTI